MGARLLRSSLLAAALAVLLVGVPVLLLGAWQLDRAAGVDVARRADAVLTVLLADPAAPPAARRSAVAAALQRGGREPQLHVHAVVAGATVDVGPVPAGRRVSRTAAAGTAAVRVELPRQVVDARVAALGVGLLLLGLLALAAAVAAARVQARRLAGPLSALADNAERVGRGEARLMPVRSGVPELDRVAAGLQRSAESLAAALAAEREFASDASHQLRTPLTALSMRLEEIGTSDDRDEVREEARIALHQVERLTSVVDSLLVRARRSHRSAVPVDLRAMLAQQEDEWTPAFRERRRRLVVAPLEPVRVLATPSALSQVLATLLENSLQHGQGAATVTARRTGRSVVVEVTDEGPGVPRHIGPRVFERSVSSSGSTGLGLALARDLAEADGGRLELLRATPPVFALFLNAEEPASP